MAEPDFNSDPWLDARLRNVPLPVNLLAKLQEIGTAETQQLDQALRNVPVPPDLADRLRAISRQPQKRFAWNAGRFAWNAGRFAWNAGRFAWNADRFATSAGRPAWRELAKAAAVLLAVGLGSLTIVSLVLKSVEPIALRGPADKALARDSAARPDGRGADSPLASDRKGGSGPLDEGDMPAGPRAPGGDRHNDRLAHEDMPLDDWSDPSEFVLDDFGPRTAMDLVPGPGPALPKPARQKSAASLQPDDLLGARVGADALPDLDAVEIHLPHGLTPPRVAGYDLLYQLKYGQHPFVDPAAHKDLRAVQLPLVTSSASYRRAWRWLKEGRLPAADDLRTEEFLAALDFGFPAVAEGKLAIRTAGGPAPLRDEGLSLLQVAVQAGPLPHEAHGPTELTIVLDTSAGMRRAERWTGVQTALSRLRDAMGPGDRVTLIGYSSQPELLVDSVTREEGGRLVSALQTSQPHRAANLAAGVLLASSMLPQPGDKPAANGPATEPSSLQPQASSVTRRLLIISSGRIDSDTESTQRACGRLAELAQRGLSLQVLDLGRDNSLAGATATDKPAADNKTDNKPAADNKPVADKATAEAAGVGGTASAAAASQGKLATWAEAGDGRLIRVADPSTLSWNLLEALIGRSPVVAARTSLRVSFNPKVVAGYRLIGHERTTITGPALAQTEIDLRAGETATGLFEVWLRPTGGNDVATVDVDWQLPNYGKEQHLKQTVSRSQFARSFSAAAPSLQAAALAALTTETLRGSPYAPASRSLARVIELARESSPALQSPSLRELTEFIQLAERARLHGAALRRQAEGK